jgi:hypothetical protein
MPATAIKRTGQAKTRNALKQVLVFERPLGGRKSALALAAEVRKALIDRGVGRDKKPVRVKITVQAETAGAQDAPEEAAFDPRTAGLQLVEKLKAAEGGAWSGNQLKKRFDLSPATLHGRRKTGRIVFWRDARHEFFYPQWQFTEAGAVHAGVEKILRIFNSGDEWRIMRYFLSPRRQLDGKNPLDLLRAGEVEKVVAHARNNLAEGSW